MRKIETFRPLAASLADLRWTEYEITAHLRQRLPPGWDKTPDKIGSALIMAFPGPVAPDAGRIATKLASLGPAQRLWRHARRLGRAPDFPLEPPPFRPIPPLDGLGLPELTSHEELADWLALTVDQLVRFADLRGLSALTPNAFAPHYRHHLVPKSSRGLRLIEEPKPFLKRLQRRILCGLLDRVPPHEASHGFRRGRNCAGAAAQHCSEAVVLCFDLRDFFPGLAVHRVYALFRALGYPAAVARNLAGLTTVVTPREVLATPGLDARDPLTARHLPQGAPTSPALANLLAHRLDCRLAGLARALDARYTRYADDLTFSGDRHIAATLLRTVPQIVRDEGFHLNPAKTRVMPATARQTVTGLTVNRHVNLPRPEYDRLKATLHHLARPDDPRRADPAFLARLSGRIAWVQQVNPHRGMKLRLAFDALT